MLYESLSWHGPCELVRVDFSHVPAAPGVYVFTESVDPLKPNEPVPPVTDANYPEVISRLRDSPCVLYVGKAKRLSRRLPGYRFKPYLEIKRRPIGMPARHTADPHKGRALVHAHQFYYGPVYLWWAETPDPKSVEAALIHELHPVLNTVGASAPSSLE